MKKLVAFAAVIAAVSFASCGNKAANAEVSNDSAAVVEETTVVEEAAPVVEDSAAVATDSTVVAE